MVIVELRDLMQRIGDGNFAPRYALCFSALAFTSLDINLDAYLLHIGIDWRDWPKYSGEPKYPVPHPLGNAKDGYENANRTHTYYEGEYGENRLELAAWIAEELTHKINSK